jgi:hypothetical protein
LPKQLWGGRSDRQQRRRDSGNASYRPRADSPGGSRAGGDSDSNSAGNEGRMVGVLKGGRLCRGEIYEKYQVMRQAICRTSAPHRNRMAARYRCDGAILGLSALSGSTAQIGTLPRKSDRTVPSSRDLLGIPSGVEKAHHHLGKTPRPGEQTQRRHPRSKRGSRLTAMTHKSSTCRSIWKHTRSSWRWPC